MIAKELISGMVPPLKTSDSGDKALIWMHEFNISRIPVIEKDKYVGLISEEEVLDFDDPTDPISKQNLTLFRPFVNEDAHVYEVIKVAAELSLSVIPVLNKEENYLGVITLENIVKFFSSLSSINETGGIIALELDKNSYSMAEIGRIVESNNASILSSYVSEHKDSTKLEVTIKLNVADPKNIIATFERFKYTVIGTYQESEYFEDLKERYDALMSYLKV